MSVAPSEKHLEDWIVVHPDAISYMSGLQIIGRQVRLPSGRVDLLALYGNRLYAIELKAGTVDSESLQQVLKYQYDLQCIYDTVLLQMDTLDFRQNTPQEAIDELETGSSQHVGAVLIGYNFHEITLQAASGSHLWLFEYRFDGTNYTFEFAFNDPDDEFNDQLACGFIGEAIRTIIRKRIAYYERMEGRQ